MTMPANVLVIHDPATGEVLRVVVPDTDEQLDTQTFHQAGEDITKVSMDVFWATVDLRELKYVIAKKP